MKPESVLKITKEFEKNLTKLSKSYVAVGLPQERVGGKVYGNGKSVIEIGMFHEFGTQHIPVRSFLRVPFAVKRDELNKFINKQLENVFDGSPVDKALALIGIKAQQVSQDSFSNNGYGMWSPLLPATVKAKGSSVTLIDTGTLRASITYIVRGG